MLSILGFIAVFIATYFIYKTAKDTGRNAGRLGFADFRCWIRTPNYFSDNNRNHYRRCDEGFGKAIYEN